MRHPLRGSRRRKVRSSFNELNKIEDRNSSTVDENEGSVSDSSATQNSNLFDMQHRKFRKNNSDRKKLMENFKLVPPQRKM